MGLSDTIVSPMENHGEGAKALLFLGFALDSEFFREGIYITRAGSGDRGPSRSATAPGLIVIGLGINPGTRYDRR